MKKLVYISIIGIILFFLSASGVNAQVCWPTRTINEHSCTSCSGGGYYCANAPGGATSESCDPNSSNPCGTYGTGPCIFICTSWSGGSACQVTNTTVSCSGPPSCSWTGTVRDGCNVVGPNCSPTTSTYTYGCWGPGGTPTPPGGGGTPPPAADECTVDLVPAVSSVSPTSSVSMTANVTIVSGTVDSVDFVSSDTGVVTVAPASDVSSPYETEAVGQAFGTTTVRADAIMGGSVTCTDTATVNVTEPGPWWQVIDADIFSLGNLVSDISPDCTGACSAVFDLDGPGGFPGLPIYSGSYNFGSGTTSSTNWLAEATFNDTREYKYSFFDRRVPADTIINEITSPLIPGTDISTGGTPFDGYYWYHFDGDAYGDLTITSDVTIAADRKVILFVESADLLVQGNIAIQSDGQGFLLVIVGETPGGAKGNIDIAGTVGGADDGVPEIEGLFVADNEFTTGSTGVDSDSQLHIRGSVAAYSGISLQRDLTDDTQTPAEVIEYAPELMLVFPKSLSLERMRWEEVAP